MKLTHHDGRGDAVDPFSNFLFFLSIGWGFFFILFSSFFPPIRKTQRMDTTLCG